MAMTEEDKKRAEEFEAQQDEILKGIPKEFHAYFKYQAWDRGHSAGYAEVLNELRGALDMFDDALVTFTINFTNDIKRKVGIGQILNAKETKSSGQIWGAMNPTENQ